MAYFKSFVTELFPFCKKGMVAQCYLREAMQHQLNYICWSLY